MLSGSGASSYTLEVIYCTFRSFTLPQLLGYVIDNLVTQLSYNAALDISQEVFPDTPLFPHRRFQYTSGPYFRGTLSNIYHTLLQPRR